MSMSIAVGRDAVRARARRKEFLLSRRITRFLKRTSVVIVFSIVVFTLGTVTANLILNFLN